MGENGSLYYDFEPTYKNLKALAESNKGVRGRPGVQVNDLLALNKGNDPFYFGSDTEQAMAKWFAKLWEERGYTGGKHIRRIHYELTTESHDTYHRHDGSPYLHDEDSRNYLHRAAIAARHLGLIDTSLFSDMRLKDPIQGFESTVKHLPGTTEPGFEQLEGEMLWTYPEITFEGGNADYELPSFRPTGYSYCDIDQPYRLEAWFEKEVGTNTLLPVCRRYNVHLLVGAGNISITQADLFLRRVVEDGRPTRILYFADFDVAGHQMPVSVARQIEYLLYSKKHSEVANIALHRIAITKEQIEGDNPRGERLPRKPVQLKSDNPNMSGAERQKHSPVITRLKNFEKKHGAGYTEVNALNENELAEVLEQEAKRYRDPTLRRRLWSAEFDARSLLATETEERIGHYTEELDSLVEEQNGVVSGYRALARRLNARMQRELRSIHDRIQEIGEEIEGELEGYGEDLELPERPEPETEGDPKPPLFESERKYFDQLNYYRRYQGRGDLVLPEGGE